MFRKVFSLALTVLLLQFNSGSVFATAQAGQDKQRPARVKKDIAKHHGGKKERVTIKLQDGRKLRGHIDQAGEDSFIIRDSETGTTTTVAYSDVTQIKRKGLSTSQKVLIGVGILMFIGAIVTAPEWRR